MNRPAFPRTPTLACRKLAGGLAAALVLLAAACGPGVGGTGTGLAVAVITSSGNTVGVATATQDLPDFGLAAWGAQPAPVCGAPFAGLLQCAGAGSGTLQPDAAGTAPLYFADPSRSQVVVAMASNTIAVRQGCPGLGFTGLWGSDGRGGDRFYGSAVLASGVVPAALTVHPAGPPASPSLSLRLVDRQGSELLSVQGLVPVTQPPTPADCP
jgi:hypothetical protein